MTRKHEQCIRTIAAHRSEGSFQIGGLKDVITLERHTQRLHGTVYHAIPPCGDSWMRRLIKTASSGKIGDHLFEELEPLRIRFSRRGRQPSDVPSWSCKTRDKPKGDRIANVDHDHRDCARCLLRSPRRGRGYRHDHVHLEADQLTSKSVVVTGATSAPPVLNGDVLPFDIAELTQSLAERFVRRARRDSEITDAHNPLARRLRGGGERQEEDAEGDRADERPSANH